MALRPQTVSDLYLAPVALRIDGELESLSGLGALGLRDHIALRTSRTPFSVDERRRFLLDAVAGRFELRGWTAEWVPRGLALRNGDFRVVLGVPDPVRAYLEL